MIGADVFDREKLLRNLDGDETMLHQIVNLFLASLSAEIELLKTGLDSNDSAVVEKQAHKMKGATANIHAESMRNIFADIEACARKGELGRVPSLLEILEFQVSCFKTSLGR